MVFMYELLNFKLELGRNCSKTVRINICAHPMMSINFHNPWSGNITLLVIGQLYI